MFITKDEDFNTAQILNKEDQAQGRSSFQTYKKLFRMYGSWLFLILVVSGIEKK
jgi:hypothetical protein